MSKVIDRRRELRNDKHDEDAIDAIVLAEQVERIADALEKRMKCPFELATNDLTPQEPPNGDAD